MKPIPELAAVLSGIKGLDAKEEFARRCGTTLGQLKQIAGGHRRCGEATAINIERESARIGRRVDCETLRSDVDWAYLRGTAKRRARANSARACR